MVLRNLDDPPIESPDDEEEGTSFIDRLVAACAPCDGDEDWPEAATQDLPEPSQADFVDRIVAACAPCDGDEDWPEAATQDLPEPSQAERLVLQARIAALDPAEDEAILELSCHEAAQAA